MQKHPHGNNGQQISLEFCFKDGKTERKKKKGVKALTIANNGSFGTSVIDATHGFIALRAGCILKTNINFINYKDIKEFLTKQKLPLIASSKYVKA